MGSGREVGRREQPEGSGGKTPGHQEPSPASAGIHC